MVVRVKFNITFRVNFSFQSPNPKAKKKTLSSLLKKKNWLNWELYKEYLQLIQKRNVKIRDEIKHIYFTCDREMRTQMVMLFISQSHKRTLPSFVRCSFEREHLELLSKIIFLGHNGIILVMNALICRRILPWYAIKGLFWRWSLTQSRKMK